MIIYIILHSVLLKKTKCDRLYTILPKNGGTDTKATGQPEPQFLPDPMSDRKKVFANSDSSLNVLVYICSL